MTGLRPLTADVAKLEDAVCAMRSQGIAYEEIAQRLGLSGKGQAYRICQRALRRVPSESVTEMRTVEGQRLDEITTTLWPRALGGDIRAIGALLKVMERRARLFGLESSLSPPESPRTPTEVDEVSFLVIERLAVLDDLVEQGAVALPPHLQERDI
jgi:hypothetical protein